MILANSKFVTIPTRFDSFKISFFVNDYYVLLLCKVNKFKNLTPQNTFLEVLRL